jgi:hypothetical protein
MTTQENVLINILNLMYNDNLRQIINLQESNNYIRSLISEMLLNPTRNNNRRTRSAFDVFMLGNDNNRLFDFESNNFRNISERRQRRQSNIRINNMLNNQNNFFEPIQVYPTQTQIENATRNVLYRDIVNPANQSCPISLETFHDNDQVSVIRYCGHIFNGNELRTWFRSNCRCPVCRYDIRNYISNTNLENNTNETNETNEPNQNTSTLQNENTSTNNETTQNNNLINALSDIILTGYLSSNSNNNTINGLEQLEHEYIDIIFPLTQTQMPNNRSNNRSNNNLSQNLRRNTRN